MRNHTLITTAGPKQDSSEDETNQQQQQNNHKQLANNIKKSIVNEKYFNLRKLNPNRIEKFNYFNLNSLSSSSPTQNQTNLINSDSNQTTTLNQSNFSNDLTEFLRYFNLIEIDPNNNNTKRPTKSNTNVNNLNIDRNLLNLSNSQFDQQSSDFDSQISKFDIELNKPTNETPQTTWLTDLKFHIPVASSNKSIFDCLNRSCACIAPNDFFQHVQTYLKQTHNNSQDNSYFKYELVYDKFNYWIVKLKIIHPFKLYQIKFVRSTTTTTTNSPQTTTNENLQQQQQENVGLNEIDFNNCYFLSLNSLKRLVKYLKPIGWSKKNSSRQAKIPSFLSDDFNSLIEILDKQNSIDEQQQQENENEFSLLIKEESDLNDDQFKIGNLCELIEFDCVWVGRVDKNVSGRLLIDLIGRGQKQWIHCFDSHLKPFGWANKRSFKYNNLNYLQNEFDLLESTTASGSLVNSSDSSPINQQINLKQNYLVECLYDNKFYVGKVIEISLNNDYMKLKLDSADPKLNNLVLTYFHTKLGSNFHLVFPCNWCLVNNFRLELTSEWTEAKKFDWNEYTSYLNSNNGSDDVKFIQTKIEDVNTVLNWSRSLNQTSEKFKIGMYLECVIRSIEDTQNEEKLDELKDYLCLGQIKAKLGHLLFIQLFTKFNQDHKLHIYSIDSLDLFPIGWSEINNYPKFDTVYFESTFLNNFKVSFNENEIRSDFNQIPILSQYKSEDEWCDRIYLNTNRFNCGPYFLKSKLNTLPKCFGPGPIVLVLYKLIQMLINISEKPFKLARILQASRRLITNNNNNTNNGTNSNVNPNLMQTLNQSEKSKYMKRVRLKAKEKSKGLDKEFDLEICTNRIQLNEYLNDLCAKLKCCNEMLSIKEPQTSNSNFDEYLQANKQISIEIKCCLLCTINYYPECVQNNTTKTSIEIESKNLIKKLSISNNNKKSSTESNIPKLNGTNSNLKLSPLNKKVKTNKNLSDILNNSPIKTRLNLRKQNFLLALKQQKLVKQKQYQENTKINKSVDDERRLKDEQSVKNGDIVEKNFNIRLQSADMSSDEPVIKRPKKINLNKSLGEKSSIQKSTPNTLSQSQSASSLHNYSTNSNQLRVNSITNSPQLITNINKTNTPTVSSANSSSNIANLITSTGISLKNSLFSNTNDTNCINSMNSVNVNLNTNPIYWSSKDICNYLQDNKFDSNLIYLIEEHEIDGQSFLMLNLPTIQNYMNLKLGPAIKLAHLVEKLKLIYFQNFQQQQQLNKP